MNRSWGSSEILHGQRDRCCSPGLAKRDRVTAPPRRIRTRTSHGEVSTRAESDQPSVKEGVSAMSAQPQWEHIDVTRRPAEVPGTGMQAGSDRIAARVVTVVALTSIAAGAIHVSAASTLGKGDAQNLAFFGVVAAAQIVWGLVALARAPRWWLVLGVLGNAVVMLTWIVSRTVGLPFGEFEGVVLPVAYPDALATALEAVTIAGAAWLAVRGSVPAASAARARGFALAAAVVIGALALTGIVSQANALSGGGGGGQNVPGAPSGGAYGGGGSSSGGSTGGGGGGSTRPLAPPPKQRSAGRPPPSPAGGSPGG